MEISKGSNSWSAWQGNQIWVSGSGTSDDASVFIDFADDWDWHTPTKPSPSTVGGSGYQALPITVQWNDPGETYDQADVDHFVYKVDNGGTSITYGTSVQYISGGSGTYTFYVKTVDDMGADSPYGSCTFKIDETNPTTPSIDDGVSGWSSDNTPTFS